MPPRKSSGWLHNAANVGWVWTRLSARGDAPRQTRRSVDASVLGLQTGPRGEARALLCAALIAGLSSLGCGGTPSPAGSQTVNVAGGVTTAIAAGVLWAAGGGCRLQGCPYGSYCNHKSGFCEVRKCSQGCPDGTICNEGLGRCQAPPPAAPPNDFLPEDNLLQQRP